jgi:hypothetical protein
LTVYKILRLGDLDSIPVFDAFLDSIPVFGTLRLVLGQGDHYKPLRIRLLGLVEELPLPALGVEKPMLKKSVLALALLSFASAAYAATPPELSLSDGSGNSVNIDSTGAVTCVGACSTSFVTAPAGSISWSGTVGAFTVNIISGQTKPTLPPPQINLGFLVSTGATGGGTLTVKWTDTGFDGLGPVTMSAANTLNGSVSATYTGYVDNTNTPFGVGTPVGSIGPFTSTNSGTLTGPGPTAEPFSMTNVVTAVMGPSSAFSLAGFSLAGTPPPALSLACASASGQVGLPYDSFLMAMGGFPPYVFSIPSGSLPPGLTLNPTTGEISGTPSTAGTFSFTSQVVDSSGNPSTNTVQSSCGITITTPPVPLALSCAASTGVVGVAYSSSLVATGGVPTYTFSIIAGSLPTGLSLNSTTGAITGLPTTAGSFPFTAQVMDSSGGSSNMATASCGITISGPPTASCVVINAVQGVAITPVTMTGSGGVGGPYTFSATGLPAGLTMSSSGTISGTPTASGTFPYTVTVTDKAGNTGTFNCSVTVVSPIALACATSTGQVGTPYSSALVATGGVPSYTFSISGGSLPPGLGLSPSTGAITGTPTAAGTFSFTGEVVDSSGNSGSNTATNSCSIVITTPNTTPPAISSGDTATIGFWHNKNGQALILSLNGGASSKALANWLATNFPYLYGVHSSNNLTNETNTNVAALFLTYFGVSGQKTSAQILAGALASYVTSSTLAGTSAIGYGFNSSPGGSGAKSYNVGSDGTAIGLVNNQSYTMLQLLQQANTDEANGTFNANAFNDIFSGINQSGDIS